MKITEMSASDKLDEFRAEMGNFIRPSFGANLVLTEQHGAMCALYIYHRRPDVELKEGRAVP